MMIGRCIVSHFITATKATHYERWEMKGHSSGTNHEYLSSIMLQMPPESYQTVLREISRARLL